MLSAETWQYSMIFPMSIHFGPQRPDEVASSCIFDKQPMALRYEFTFDRDNAGELDVQIGPVRRRLVWWRTGTERLSHQAATAASPNAFPCLFANSKNVVGTTLNRRCVERSTRDSSPPFNRSSTCLSKASANSGGIPWAISA